MSVLTAPSGRGVYTQRRAQAFKAWERVSGAPMMASLVA